MSTTLDRNSVLNILESYFEGLFNNEVENIPLSADVTFKGPMVAETLVGIEKVNEFLVDVAASFANAQYHTVRDIIDGRHVCSVIMVRLSEGQILEMCNVFEIKRSKIISVNTYFDPRPMLG